MEAMEVRCSAWTRFDGVLVAPWESVDPSVPVPLDCLVSRLIVTAIKCRVSSDHHVGVDIPC